MIALWLLLAVGLHELGHLAAAWDRGLSTRLVAGWRGVGVAYWREDAQAGSRLPRSDRLFVSAMGPVVSLIAAGDAWVLGLGMFAVVSFLVGILNLAPVPGSDGWRIMEAVRPRSVRF